MTQIVIFTAVYMYFIIFDLYPLYKEKKTFWVNASIITVSYVFCILMSIDINIPSPSVPIKNAVESIISRL